MCKLRASLRKAGSAEEGEAASVEAERQARGVQGATPSKRDHL